MSALAETAYTLTATITPADATNKAVDWSIAFKNASSSWASGKNVTDYVTVTPSADGALTAVVSNLKAFGEQITVKATSRDNASAYATCTVDYVQKIVSPPYLKIGDIEFVNNGETEIDFEISPDSTGPGGIIDFGVALSEVYTIPLNISPYSYDLMGEFYFESIGETIEFHSEGYVSDGYSLFFDRTMFIDDPDNGREALISGEPVSEEFVNELTDQDIIKALIYYMPMNGAMNCNFMFYTEYTGQVYFSSEVRFNIVEAGVRVESLSLDKDAIKF